MSQDLKYAETAVATVEKEPQPQSQPEARQEQPEARQEQPEARTGRQDRRSRHRSGRRSSDRISRSESHARSALKAITWQFVATVTAFGIGYGLTGSISGGVQLSVAEVVIKAVLYYAHERLWVLLPSRKLERIFTGNHYRAF